MRQVLRLLLILVSVLGGRAFAQPIVTSPGPDRVAVTVYRDSDRPPQQPVNLNWPNGYALVSETRQVSIPAGESQIRFEGVAAGLVPQSAIVSGFPEGIVERNRDAYLLSPATLLDRSLGARVHLRRTSLATGAVREQDAVIRSGAGGAVVLQTADGFESLRCTGLPEALVYDEVPPGLSARPTLSVRVRSSNALTATVTLSYLAQGFDWQANYIAQLAPDGGHLDLFAWLTLVNGDETGFANADANAVAGRLNREAVAPQPTEGGALQLQCWPSATTSDIAEVDEENLDDFARGRAAMAPPPPPPPPPAEAVVVTGTSVMRAQLEALGDVKLYRIPEPVTVAANSQKQVALIEQPGVRIDFAYRHTFHAANGFEDQPVPRVMVTRNRTAEGLGVPLPAGRLVLFGTAAGRPILLGEGFVADRAVGEDVEVTLGPASGVRDRLRRVDAGKGPSGEYELIVTNDGALPVRYEAEIGNDGVRVSSRTRLGRRNGQPLWMVDVPANGSAVLRYRIRGN